MNQGLFVYTDTMMNYVFNKIFMVKDATEVSWKAGHPDRNEGLICYTDRSKTSAGTGAECCASRVSR